MRKAALLALWIAVTGPGGQRIVLNEEQIVSIRAPRVGEHFGADVRCLIHTTDGKFVTTLERCDAVRSLLTPPD